MDGTQILKQTTEDIFFKLLSDYYKNSGAVDMPHPHVDEGWLKKWGRHKEPVNYIGGGYLSGMFSAAFGKPTGTYKVTETQSKVMGAGKSHFKAAL